MYLLVNRIFYTMRSHNVQQNNSYNIYKNYLDFNFTFGVVLCAQYRYTILYTINVP